LEAESPFPFPIPVGATYLIICSLLYKQVKDKNKKSSSFFIN